MRPPPGYLPQSLDELRRAYFSAAWLAPGSTDVAAFQLWNPASSGYEAWLFALHSKPGNYSGANRFLGYLSTSVLVANVQPSLCYADVTASAAEIEFRAEVLGTWPSAWNSLDKVHDLMMVTNEWPENHLFEHPIRLAEGTGLALIAQVTGPDWWIGCSFLELPV